jgi:phosphotransferase system enzyme I (PtsI)
VRSRSTPSEDRREQSWRRRDARCGPGRSPGPAHPRDGHHVALLANIGGVEDAEEAGAQDLEGVGLFRTEFVFLSADKAPTVEEQTEIYTKVFAPFGTAGSSCAPSTREPTSRWPSPTSGRRRTRPWVKRGLRLSAERPELLDAQLEACRSRRR